MDISHFHSLFFAWYIPFSAFLSKVFITNKPSDLSTNSLVSLYYLNVVPLSKQDVFSNEIYKIYTEQVNFAFNNIENKSTYAWIVLVHQLERQFATSGELQQSGSQRRIFRISGEAGFPQCCPLSESFLVLFDPPLQLG